MAVMIPDSCPSKATAGEKRTFALLRDALPDHFTAWYEATIAGRYPDFTLLADDLGLLMLEVKGWRLGEIAQANDNEVELHRTKAGQVHVEIHKHPTRQVRDYLFALMDEMAKPEFAILQQPDGRYRGRPCFPCGYGVLLTGITRTQLDGAGLTALFPPERAICSDELAALERAGDREVIRRLKRFFPAPFPFDPLTEDQAKTLKGILHREVIVRRRPATADSAPKGQGLLPGAVALDVLDTGQEQVARSLGSGHRIVFGIAGSGKTVLLLARARLAAARDPGRKVLVLCFNKALAAYLAAALDVDPTLRNVEVRHFDSWLARRTGLRKADGEDWERYRARMVDAMLRAVDLWPEAERYDAVLIDEGHDFAPEWLRCVTWMLRGGPEGELLIALDGAQNLYNRGRKFTWKSVGIQAAGRTRRLDRNYRNTKQILEFAWQVAQPPPRDDEESETHVRVLPRKASRQGAMPVYAACATAAEEQARIVRLVEGFRAGGIADRDIAVLYPRNERGGSGQPGRVEALLDALRRLGDVCWLAAENDTDGLRRSLAGPGVRLSTIHASKGLEFRAVVLAALDLLPNPWDADEIRDGNLLYVGLTRATDHLAVTWAGRSAFTDRVLRSKAEPLRD
jgi:hypothetical protein